jgi:nitrate/nitrite transport system ATP-binding protein
VAFIEADRISKSFATAAGGRHVLENVSLGVDRGEFVAIVGVMGCGKSTLLGILAGLQPADAGAVRIAGEPVRGVRSDAALVFQNYSLLPWFSALENVRLAVDAAFPDWPKARQREQATRSLERVGLGGALDRPPSQLSGGMRQRVAIARAFAIEPEVLFLDEPFGALDALTRDGLQQELARLCSSAERPVTSVMITNSVEEAILLADRIIPMTRGPRATLLPPIPVALPRPRTAALLARSPDAVHVRATIVEALTGAVQPARAAQAPGAARVRASDGGLAAALARAGGES